MSSERPARFVSTVRSLVEFRGRSGKAAFLPEALLAMALLLLWFHGAAPSATDSAVGAMTFLFLAPPVASSILLMVAFAGWGSVVARVAVPGRPVDFGLRCAWGMGLLAFAGGTLVLLHAAPRPVLLVILALGSVLFLCDALWERARPRIRRRGERDLLFGLGAAFVVSVALLRLVGEAGHPVSHDNDEPVAYWVFIKEFLETGGSDQPFSLRRIMLYGGQTLFQALLATRTPIETVSVFDRALCPLILVALVAGFPVARGIPRALLLAPMLIVASGGQVADSSGSHYSGALVLFGLYRTMTFWPAHPRFRVPSSTTTALMAVAAWSLRPNLGLVAALTIGGSFAWRLAVRGRTRPSRVRPMLLEALRTMVCALVFVSPWALASVAHFRTPLFPAISGTYTKASAVFDTGMPFYWRVYFALLPPFATWVKALWLFVVACFTLRDPHSRRPLHAFVIATLLCSMLFSAVLHEGTERYNFPYQLASILAISAAAIASVRRSSPTSVGFLLVAIACFTQIQEQRSVADDMYAKYLAETRDRLRSPVEERSTQTRDPSYERLQAAVPRGEAIITMVDAPYLFDFSRNHVMVIDYPGIVSPAPGLPLLDGPEAMAKYFLSHSIRYAIVVDDGGEHLYSHHGGPNGGWVAVHGDPAVNTNAASAPYFLGALDGFDHFRRTRRTLLAESGMRVLDLATGI
jgi:hypothetical protein